MEGEEIGDGSVVIAKIHSRPHIQESKLISRGFSRQGVKMCLSVKSRNIRDMTKKMEQKEAMVKASISRTETLPTSSTLSTAGAEESVFGSMSHILSELKRRRGSISWIKHSTWGQGKN